jgi:hypothetical protein
VTVMVLVGPGTGTRTVCVTVLVGPGTILTTVVVVPHAVTAAAIPPAIAIPAIAASFRFIARPAEWLVVQDLDQRDLSWLLPVLSTAPAASG